MENNLYTYTIWEHGYVDQYATVYGVPYNEKVIRGNQFGIYPSFNMLIQIV